MRFARPALDLAFLLQPCIHVCMQHRSSMLSISPFLQHVPIRSAFPSPVPTVPWKTSAFAPR